MHVSSPPPVQPHLTNIGHFGEIPNPLLSILFTPKCTSFKFKRGFHMGWVDGQNPILPPPLSPNKGKEKRKEKKRKPCQTHHQLSPS